MSEFRSPENTSAATVETECPLSHGQRALWFLNRLAPASSAFNVVFAARVLSRIDPAGLRRAFQSLLDRHAALRTTYFEREGDPRQRIHGRLTVHFEQIDVSTWTDQALYDRLAAEARRPFDLEHGPVLRVSLFSRSESEHFLALTIHHIAVDGWSLWICLDELRILYSAESAGVKAALSLPVWQYPDYIRWQEELIGGPEGKKLWAYWEEKLAGEIPVLNLPTDRPRPLTQTFRGASHFFKLDEVLTKKLKSFAQAQRTTLYTLLLTAFQVLLHRYTGQEDILVGSPSSGRQRRELEGIVGYCVNPIVLRSKLAGDPPLKVLLNQVRETVLDAFERQTYPFPLLVDRLQPLRDPSRPSLCQVMFVLQTPQLLREEGISSFILGTPGGRVTLGELVLESLPFPIQQEGQFDLTLQMVETGESFSASFDYSTDLFDPATMVRMGRHFTTLLKGIVGAPDQRIAELPLLVDEERHQLLVEWNDTKRNYPRDKCVHELFEEQAAKSPDAVAVVYGEQQLTYGELNRRANQLAHYLRKRGVGAESLVGICVERSLEMVVGFLGILKAGGAYVPLDPDYPEERLGFMVQDSQVAAVLTQEEMVEHLLQHTAELIKLDRNWQEISRESEENLGSGVTAENLAYVIYTSGSTGRPKGISIPHKAIHRLVFNTNYIALEPSDRIAQASNASFDAATFEIWGALLHGAQLVGISKNVILSPEAFSAEIRGRSISTLFLTTALLNHLASEAPGAFQSVRHLLFGGEAVDPRWVNEVLTVGPPKRLLHVYGPTETTTFASFHLIEQVPQGATTIPIGCPISNTEIYLLDKNLQPVPIGVPGEIHIGGDGLARGYLNSPELTSERFIPHPFSDEPGARLYKTGDLAGHLPDGSIKFIGRLDHQVKIRGFRIELGEIETILAQHPAIRDTVVTVREDIPGDKRLVAYIVEQEQLDREQVINDLRAFVRAKLPAYMVPSAFVVLEAMPLTPNGKVDLSALPLPGHTSAELAGKSEAARTPTEELLAAIWSEVLDVKEVSVHDNFFDLGGHSLLATVVISRIRNGFNMELPLHVLFEAPTLAALAEEIETMRRKLDWSPDVSAAKGSGREQGGL
jgi:amino acid adenylation domain-containing protein